MTFNPEKSVSSEPPIHLKELSAEDLEEARLLASDTTREFEPSSQMQAENMARFAGVELQPEESRLYCALREQMSPSMNGGAKGKDGPGSRAWRLSDQELLAQVLHESGNEDRLRKFVAFYPNIFS